MSAAISTRLIANKDFAQTLQNTLFKLESALSSHQEQCEISSKDNSSGRDCPNSCGNHENQSGRRWEKLCGPVEVYDNRCTWRYVWYAAPRQLTEGIELEGVSSLSMLCILSAKRHSSCAILSAKGDWLARGLEPCSARTECA